MTVKIKEWLETKYENFQKFFNNEQEESFDRCATFNTPQQKADEIAKGFFLAPLSGFKIAKGFFLIPLSGALRAAVGLLGTTLGTLLVTLCCARKGIKEGDFTTARDTLAWGLQNLIIGLLEVATLGQIHRLPKKDSLNRSLSHRNPLSLFDTCYPVRGFSSDAVQSPYSGTLGQKIRCFLELHAAFRAPAKLEHKKLEATNPEDKKLEAKNTEDKKREAHNEYNRKCHQSHPKSS